jgi:hypothetical protein
MEFVLKKQAAVSLNRSHDQSACVNLQNWYMFAPSSAAVHCTRVASHYTRFIDSCYEVWLARTLPLTARHESILAEFRVWISGPTSFLIAGWARSYHSMDAARVEKHSGNWCESLIATIVSGRNSQYSTLHGVASIKLEGWQIEQYCALRGLRRFWLKVEDFQLTSHAVALGRMGLVHRRGSTWRSPTGPHVGMRSARPAATAGDEKGDTDA